MIEYGNKDKKPFKLGQLLLRKGLSRLSGIFLVLDCEWDHDYRLWKLDLIQQRTGVRNLWMPLGFEPAEPSDD